MNTTLKTHVLACFLMVWFCVPTLAFAADEDGCVVCHKYSGLARLDQKTGQLRLFYVNYDKFNNSVHGKVLCKNCHLNLDVIPHNNAKKVDCSTKCHVKEPSKDVEFSHGNLYAEINMSIHGKGTKDNPKKFSTDMPGCTDCHLNTVYKPVQGFDQDPGISRDTLRRCIGCHTEEDWATRYYQHFSHRLHRSKTALETAKLCLNCHQDEQMMARHNLPATANYRDTFHWKGVLYGDKNAPDCLSCHAPIGYSVHSLTSMHDPQSPVYRTNLQSTCASVDSTQQCHPGAVESFATGKIHQTEAGFDEKVAAFVKGDPVLDGVNLLERKRRYESQIESEGIDTAAIDATERFQRKVYLLVKYIYTLLITVVIGGMLIHQLMDFYRTIKNRKNH